MDDPKFTRTNLPSPTGAQLAVYQCSPSGRARGVVHVNHGLAEHAARYRGFAAYLASRGYHVIAQDHRGHGETVAADGGPRRFADQLGWQKLIGDVAEVIAFAKRTHPDLPVVIFGHSMGGVIALNQAMRAPGSVDAVAVWNSNMALGGRIGLMRFLLNLDAFGRGPYASARIIDAITFRAWAKRFKPQRTDFDWLSRDPAEVDAYVEDPNCGWPASISLWRDFLTGVAYAERAANLRQIPAATPIHLIGGKADPATENGAAMKKLARRLKSTGHKDVTLELLKDFRHETLNEIGREAVIEAFADWLDRVTSD